MTCKAFHSFSGLYRWEESIEIAVSIDDCNFSDNIVCGRPHSSKGDSGRTATGNFEWSPQNFAGFYYDIDKDLGTERIITTVTDEKLEEPQGIVYTTTAQKNDFDFEIWGYYNVIGFMGQKYFAGYSQDDSYDYPSILYQESIDENSLADEQLQKILMDSDSETIVTKDAPLTLAEGYVLRLKYVDEKGMLLEMFKNGAVVDSKALSPSIKVQQLPIRPTITVKTLAIREAW